MEPWLPAASSSSTPHLSTGSINSHLRRVTIPIRAGAYTDELVKIATVYEEFLMQGKVGRDGTTIYSDYLTSSGKYLKCASSNVAPSQLLSFFKAQVD
ncbi:hypothetical protein G4B88_014561 [Cannabis sativa]|uniref:Uncharacterized protein n=1 Tax=Cannabis sativa TaxID=3483 RepID=A0A7J6IAB7_CANSA|nr:hypothetical protein G4B88_014561 [Cannabis sativa]